MGAAWQGCCAQGEGVGKCLQGRGLALEVRVSKGRMVRGVVLQVRG